MTMCHQCQRDPDEYDRFLRKQQKKIEVAEAAAILLGERLDRIQQACRRAVAMLERDCGPEAYHARSVLEDALEDA